jgi:hypothetical protein
MSIETFKLQKPVPNGEKVEATAVFLNEFVSYVWRENGMWWTSKVFLRADIAPDHVLSYHTATKSHTKGEAMIMAGFNLGSVLERTFRSQTRRAA